MKTPIFGVVLGSALLVLFGSCRNKGMDNNAANSLRLAASQTDFADSVNGQTKATETKFQNGDAVGVFVHTAATVMANGNHSANMKYFTIDAGSKWSASSSLSGTLNVGSTYYSTAYYPYKQGVSNPTSVSHTIAIDQSIVAGDKATNLEQSDFMIAPSSAIDIKSPTSANVVLNFKHVLTKLVVSVGVPATIENVKTLSVKSVRIKGLNISCKVNLANGVVTPTSIAVTDDITPRLCSGNGTPGTLSSWEAIVIPQEVAPNTKMVEFICTMEDGKDKTLTYTTSASSSLKLTSGNKTTLTLSSSADLAFLSTVSFTDGSAKTDTELQIKATASTPWSVTSSASWLTLATTAGGSYAATITGTGTGNPQSIFLKVDANTSALAVPREATLTLANNTGGTMEYKVFQNYTNFAPPTTGWNITAGAGQSKALDPFASNQVWTVNTASDAVGLKIATTATGTPLALPYEVVGSLAANALFMQAPTANNTDNAKTAKLVMEIKNSAPRQFSELTITQAAPAITDFTNTLAGYSGTAAEWSSANMTVTPAKGLQWKMSADAGLTASHLTTQATAQTNVTVSAEANNSNKILVRKFYLNYGAMDGTLKTAFAVTQPAPVLKLNVATRDVAAGATSASFDVISSVNQKGVIFTPAAGMNATSVSPSGAQTITTADVNYSLSIIVNFAANTTTSARTIIATIKYGAGTLTHTITQAAAIDPMIPITIGTTKWMPTNLTGSAGTSGGHKVEATPSDYGMFFKWGTYFVYQRESSSSDGGGWGTNIQGAATTPAASNTGGLGYDYAQGLGGGTNPGDPCQKLGANYQTPTHAQWQSLVAAGKSAWTTYQNINGYFFGANAASCTNTSIAAGCIFLPASGFRYWGDGARGGQGGEGNYWASSAGDGSPGWGCDFGSGSVNPNQCDSRGHCYSVRCVEVTPGAISFAPAAPSGSVSGGGAEYSVTLTSNTTWTATASAGVTVSKTTGNSGSSYATIIVAATTAARNVWVKFTTSGVDYSVAESKWEASQAAIVATTPTVVYIGGTRWLTSNLLGTAGTASGYFVTNVPTDYGMFFKWGSAFVYQRASSSSDGGGWGSETQGAATSPSSSNTGGTGYDYTWASGGTNPGDPCQRLGNYKTPTHAQWKALEDASGYHWGTYQGISGRFFGANAASCTNTSIASGCIFLPASGCRGYIDGTQGSIGTDQYYWSSSVYDSGQCYYFTSDAAGSDGCNYRGNGYSVRCVAE